MSMRQSFFARLQKGTRNTKEIKFPGEDKLVLLQALSVEECQQAAISALGYLTRQGHDPNHAMDVLLNERSIQLLYRALRDPQDAKKPLTENVDGFRAVIDQSEVEALIGEFEIFQAECVPVIENFPEEKVAELIEAIKKNPEALSSVFDSRLLKLVITTMASQRSS